MGDKGQPAENASTRNGVDEVIKMVDIENCSTEKQMKSTFLEEDQLKILDIKTFKPQIEDDDEYLEESKLPTIIF